MDCIYENAKIVPGSVTGGRPAIAELDGSSGTISSLLPADIPGFSAGGGDCLVEYPDVDPALWNGGLDWDWLFECGENLNFSAPMGILPNYETGNGHDVLEPASTVWQPIPGPTAGDLFTRNNDQADPVFSVLPNPEPQDACEPNDPWPLEWHAEGQQALDLPKLNGKTEGMEATYYGMKSLGDAFRMKLQEAIRLPLEHPPWRAVSLANFPSKMQLDRCIDLFFAHNNSVRRSFSSLKFYFKLITIICWQESGLMHRPTFEPDRQPVVMILAIASLGACYSNMEGSRTFANALSELNRRLLWYMVDIRLLFSGLEN